jgi:gamma-glutamyltranspeptidase / glutathione hydrolase
MTFENTRMRIGFHRLEMFLCAAALVLGTMPAAQARTQKPALHAQHWMAVTGKPLAATAGAMIFQKGGNAVDAACAMIAATSTMWDTLSLIYNPNTGKVIGINALGVAPTGATPEFFQKKGMSYPPEFGPLAAVTPGTPGDLMTMLACRVLCSRRPTIPTMCCSQASVRVPR